MNGFKYTVKKGKTKYFPFTTIAGSMMYDLNKVVSDLESWETGKGIILRGEGGTFCSGGDIDTVKNTQTNELGLRMSHYMGNLMQRFSRLPMISVAMIEGNALGGGAELAVHCDFLVMSEKARFGFVQTKMGVITGWGGGTTLIRKVGATRALDLLASARVIDAIECKRLGIVNDILPQTDNVLDVTKSWLSQFCQGHIQVVRNLKSMIVAANTLSLNEAIHLERKLFSELWGSKANVDAFNNNIKH